MSSDARNAGCIETAHLEVLCISLEPKCELGSGIHVGYTRP